VPAGQLFYKDLSSQIQLQVLHQYEEVIKPIYMAFKEIDGDQDSLIAGAEFADLIERLLSSLDPDT